MANERKLSFAHNGNNDPFNRYQMPHLRIVHENVKNGLTFLANIEDVAKALQTPPEFLHYWFSLTFSRTRLPNFRLKGKLNVVELMSSLFTFIEIFLWCPKCKDPETILKLRKEGLKIQCKTCGYYAKLKLRGKHADKMARYMEKKMKERKQRARAKRPAEVVNPSKIDYLLPSQMNMF